MSSEYKIKIGTAPVSWGIMEAEGWNGHQAYARVLDEMAEAGYEGTELGPYGYLPTEPERLIAELSSRGLRLVSAFVPVHLAEARRHETDFHEAIKVAKEAGAAVLVATFPDPIGRDVVIQWPGGVNMQLYWHTTKPSYAAFETVPENRVYVSPERADAFTHSFVGFSHGKVVSDDVKAAGVEIGRPKDTYRRIRIESVFGKTTVFATDGHLPYPYGRELMGYEVTNLKDTLTKATGAAAKVLVDPFTSDRRESAIVQFPGGYIAEIHAAAK